MMAYLTRRRFSNGGSTIIPKAKPFTANMFKDKADLYIQGVHGGFGKELMLPKLQSILEKVVKDNSMSKAEALTFIQERNNFYKNFAEENPGGTLPRWEKADGGRIGFHRGKSVNTFESWLKNQIANNNTSFRTAQDLFKAAGAKSHGANQKIWNKYKNGRMSKMKWQPLLKNIWIIWIQL